MLTADMSAAAAKQPNSLASATGLLLGTLVLCICAGGLLGWLVGGAGLGLLIGAIVGIPAAVGVVYAVYSRTAA